MTRQTRAIGALAAGLAAVAATAALLGWLGAGAVEAGAEARVRASLQAEGHGWAGAEADGARVRLVGAAPDDAALAAALAAATRAAGAFVVVESAAAVAAPRLESGTALQPGLDILRDEAGAAILGVAPDAATLRRVVARLSRLIGGPVDASMARTAERPPDRPWPHWVALESEGVAAAAALPLGRVTLGPDGVSVAAPGPEAADAKLAAALERLKRAGVPVTVERGAGPPAQPMRAAWGGGRRRDDATPTSDGGAWLAASSHHGGVALNGAAPDAASRLAIASYAAAAFSGRPLDVDGLIAPEGDEGSATAPEGWRAAALAMIDALAGLDGGAARLRDGSVAVRGRALDPLAARAAEAALAPLRDRGWTTESLVTVDLPARAAAMRLGPPACAAALSAQAATEPILFAPGERALGPDAAPAVDALAAILRRCEGGAVEIGGHTDSQGSEAYNLSLSAARAKAVATALEAALARDGGPGVALFSRGYGPSQPVADNATEAGRARNRRIAFTAMADAAATVSAEAGAETGTETGTEAGTEAELGPDGERRAGAAPAPGPAPRPEPGARNAP